MNGQVQRDGHPGYRGVANELGVTQKGGGAMMVGVEEGQGLLFKDEEDGIDQLEVLGQVVHLDKSQSSGDVRGLYAVLHSTE